MNLVRCNEQGHQTLDEFFTPTLADSTFKIDGDLAMLSLIDQLRALPNDLQVWGLTSHSQLVLLAEDRSDSPWFVVIASLGTRDYFVDNLMPEDHAPWQNARVRGEAHSEDDAVRKILIAIENSKGWRT